MQEKLANISSAYPLGRPNGRNLFKVGSGAFAGRLAAIVLETVDVIKLFVADPPYTDWSSVQTIESTSGDTPFDACIDESHNIHLIFLEKTTGYVKYRKLTYTDGLWSVGAAQTIYSGASSFSPSISIEPDGKLWAAYSIYSAPNRNMYVKSSTDAGATWGTGVTDLGEASLTGFSYTYPRLLSGPSQTYLVCNGNYSFITFRSIDHSSTTWSSAQTVTTGVSINQHFDAAVGPDGILGVVWSDTTLKYREYDGANWGAVVDLGSQLPWSPQLIYRSNYPVIVYLDWWVGGAYILRYIHRQSGTFSDPKDLESSNALFDTVLLYDASAATYEDLTTAAASSAMADLFHSGSAAMIEAVGDAVIVGMNSKFRALDVNLSTIGSGGIITYSYWDGTGWKGFTPVAGVINFDSSDSQVLLWEDQSSLPLDWQMTTIEETNLFWLRMEVTGAFSTAPIGNNMAATTAMQIMSIVR